MLYLIIYIIGFILTYGLFFACLQKGWPSISKIDRGIDMFDSVISAFIWPISIIFFFKDFKYKGFKFY